MNVKFSRIFSKMRYLFSAHHDNKVKVMQMTHAGDSGSKRKQVMQREKGEFLEQDPDFEAMTAEEILAFFEALEPDVTNEELEEIGRRVYPKIITKIEREQQEKEEKHRRIGRRGLAVAVICSLLAVSAIAQALGVPVWDSVIQWTEEHFIMQFFPSQSAMVAMDFSQKNISAAVHETWGDEVCDVLMELDSVPDLPTWKPEGFRLSTIESEHLPNIGMFITIVLYNDRGDVMILTIAEIPMEDAGYAIEVEMNEGSGTVEVHNGTTYYYMTNMSQHVVVWEQDGVSINISGNIAEQDIHRMVESIE